MYPTVEDLTKELQALGYTVDTVADRLQGWLNASISRFEKESGWEPFLAGSSGNYVYDLPEWGVELDLRTGFTSITEVRTAVDQINNPDGNLLTVNQDYKLLTMTGVDTILPYIRVRFLSNLARYVKIVGTRGRVASMDSAQDVFDAILHDAALKAEERLQDKSGTIKSVRSGSVEYDLVVAKNERQETWKREFSDAITRWMRVVL